MDSISHLVTAMDKEQLLRNNATRKRQLMTEVAATRARRECDDKLIAIYGRTYGTLEGFEQWCHTSEGRGAIHKIVDDLWKAVGRENPNPRRWDTSTTWGGKKVERDGQD